MPKRSTPFQAVVRLVREHFAQPGVTVTESKMLRDVVAGFDVEVDIVIEGRLDDEPLTISIEVIEHSRPATIEWVQRMLRKHRDLPTNRLLLVSKSGFSKRALIIIENEAGRVQALTPSIIESDGQPVTVKNLFMNNVTVKASGCTPQVYTGTEVIQTRGDADLEVVDFESGANVGPLAYLVYELMNMPDLLAQILHMASEHEERDALQGFQLVVPIALARYALRHESAQYHLIVGLKIWGDLSFIQTDLPLQLTKLGDRVYGTAQVDVEGRPAVWVGTTDVEKQTTKISWRWTDGLQERRREDPPPGRIFTRLDKLILNSPPEALTPEVWREVQG